MVCPHALKVADATLRKGGRNVATFATRSRCRELRDAVCDVATLRKVATLRPFVATLKVAATLRSRCRVRVIAMYACGIRHVAILYIALVMTPDVKEKNSYWFELLYWVEVYLSGFSSLQPASANPGTHISIILF